MIQSFKTKDTESIWLGLRVRRLSIDVQNTCRRKLRMLNNAMTLNDLRVPPANRLENLRGKRAGQHSIRINDQWRLCFIWMRGNVTDVEIVDYH